MKWLFLALLLVGLGMSGLSLYANFWGKNECDKAGGKWISMNYGKYCVDKELNEIDIYNN